MYRRQLLGGAAAAAAGGLAGCLNVRPAWTKTLDRSLDARGIDAMVLYNRAGDVEVTGTAGGTVDVRAEARTGHGAGAIQDVDVHVGVDAGVLTVALAGPVGTASVEPTTVRFDVRVPATDDLAVGVEEVYTDAGDVRVRDVTGDLRVTTGTGDVDVRGLDGYLTVSTGTGNVFAADLGGIDGVTTGVGDIDVECGGMRGDVELVAEVGDVALRIPTTTAASLDLSTGAGTVGTANLDVRATHSTDAALRGHLGEGGRRLRLRTGDGDVLLAGVEG